MKYLYTFQQIKDLIFSLMVKSLWAMDMIFSMRSILIKDRSKNLNIIEFGIHHGDPLAVLSSYFPYANVIGVDRNPFSTNYKSKKIRLLHCDVFQKKNLENLSNYLDRNFDYIIDDASHNPIHQKITFFSMFKNLKSGGIL